LAADPAAGESMTEAARQALHNLDALVADNSGPLHSAIGNINTFAEALARNSNRVDNILAGLERMTGGAAKPNPVVYDLSAPRTFPASDKVTKSQLVIPEPTALITLDTQKILVRSASGDRRSRPQNGATIFRSSCRPRSSRVSRTPTQCAPSPGRWKV
jgi:phospholipid/cholesterol/gamma-HCH transport system substrate-binding protein